MFFFFSFCFRFFQSLSFVVRALRNLLCQATSECRDAYALLLRPAAKLLATRASLTTSQRTALDALHRRLTTLFEPNVLVQTLVGAVLRSHVPSSAEVNYQINVLHFFL